MGPQDGYGLGEEVVVEMGQVGEDENDSSRAQNIACMPPNP